MQWRGIAAVSNTENLAAARYFYSLINGCKYIQEYKTFFRTYYISCRTMRIGYFEKLIDGLATSFFSNFLLAIRCETNMGGLQLIAAVKLFQADTKTG